MVARVLSLSLVVAASGRSLSLRRGRGTSEPWETGTTDFMDRYSADAEKQFHQNGRAAQEMDAAEAKQDAGDPLDGEHFTEKKAAESSDTAPASGSSDAWLKLPSDSWAFMPRAKPMDDTASSAPEEPHVEAHSERAPEHEEAHAEHADTFELSPGTADFWRPSGAMDWQTELRSAQKQASDSWGMAPHKQSTESWEMAPRADVRQAAEEDVSAPSDASPAPHISSDVSSSAWGAHLSNSLSSDTSGDASDVVSSDMSSKASNDGAAVKIHAGSLGGLFDGGEDRGSHKNKKAASESSAQAPATHTGGAVVDVRLDSELQEATLKQ